MKKLSPLLLAVVSTTLLLLGSARAAEKFDTLGQAAGTTSFTDSVMDGPALPCVGGGEENPK